MSVGYDEDEAKLAVERNTKDEKLDLSLESGSHETSNQTPFMIFDLAADMNRLSRFKVMWGNAEKGEADLRLTEDEFMAFRHPESSEETTLQMANDILNYFGWRKFFFNWQSIHVFLTCRLQRRLSAERARIPGTSQRLRWRRR